MCPITLTKLQRETREDEYDKLAVYNEVITNENGRLFKK